MVHRERILAVGGGHRADPDLGDADIRAGERLSAFSGDFPAEDDVLCRGDVGSERNVHAHYDLGMDAHVNAVCTRCGRITDIHTDTLEALLGLVATRSGYRLGQGEGVIVYGLCPDCASTQVAEA